MENSIHLDSATLDQALTLLKQASSIAKEKYNTDFNSSNDKSVLEELTQQDIDPVLEQDKKLNPAIAYEVWNEDQSPENFRNLYNTLRPTVQYALAANNAVGDPLIETKAKILTAKAIKSFDPSYGSSLPTYLSNQLQKLTRYTRDVRSPIKIPERQLYAAAELARTEEEWKDKYGKDPTVSDLADAMGVSIKKIEDIRKQFIKQVSEGKYFAGATSEDDVSSNDEQDKTETEYTKEALNYIYNDLGYRDKKILEYTTGFGGSDILTPAEISKKLGISQSQISRINAKLANRVYDMQNMLKRVYS